MAKESEPVLRQYDHQPGKERGEHNQHNGPDL